MNSQALTDLFSSCQSSLLTITYSTGWLLLLFLLIRRPRGVLRKLETALMFWFVAVCALLLPRLLPLPAIPENRAAWLLESHALTLEEKEGRYQDLLLKDVRRDEIVAGQGRQAVMSHVYVRDKSVDVEGIPLVLRRIGRKSLHLGTGASALNIAEFLMFPTYEQDMPNVYGDNEEGIQPLPHRAIGMTNQKEKSDQLLFGLPELEIPPKLLVVTSLPRLEAKHGADFFHIYSWLKQLGEIYDIVLDHRENRDVIREFVRSRNLQGVLIFGDCDIVPFIKRFNPCHEKSDGDPDIVYGDDFYVNFDQDPLQRPDVDLGRIPDDPDIVGNAQSVLYRVADSHQPVRIEPMKGVACASRKAADRMVSRINPVAEGDNFFWSEPSHARDLNKQFVSDGSLYLDLFGMAGNTSVLLGEKRNSIFFPTAFTVNNAGRVDVVLCNADYSAAVHRRSCAQSVAMAFLRHGARAFIGLTGAGYRNDAGSGGGDLFWRLFSDACLRGMPPSTAFRTAKCRFIEQTWAPADRKFAAQLLFLGLPAAQPSTKRALASHLAPPGRARRTVETLDQAKTQWVDLFRELKAGPMFKAQPPLPPQAGMKYTLRENFDGWKVDSRIWNVNKAAKKTWRLKNGRLRINVKADESSEGPVTLISTENHCTFKGDLVVMMRITDHALIESASRYTLRCRMISEDRQHSMDAGLTVDHAMDADASWKAFTAIDRERKETELPVEDQPITLTLTREDRYMRLSLNGNMLSTQEAPQKAGLPYLIEVDHQWIGATHARAAIDYIYVQSSLANDVDGRTEQPEAFSTEPTSADIINLHPFNNGEWNNLGQIFTAGTPIYCWTDNRYEGTAELVFWLVYPTGQSLKISRFHEENQPENDSYNQGDHAVLQADRIAAASLAQMLEQDSIPETLSKLIQGPVIYRVRIKAPDKGYYASYLLQSEQPALCAIGKAVVDVKEKRRAMVGNVKTRAQRYHIPEQIRDMLRTMQIVKTKPEMFARHLSEWVEFEDWGPIGRNLQKTTKETVLRDILERWQIRGKSYDPFTCADDIRDSLLFAHRQPNGDLLVRVRFNGYVILNWPPVMYTPPRSIPLVWDLLIEEVEVENAEGTTVKEPRIKRLNRLPRDVYEKVWGSLRQTMKDLADENTQTITGPPAQAFIEAYEKRFKEMILEQD